MYTNLVSFQNPGSGMEPVSLGMMEAMRLRETTRILV